MKKPQSMLSKLEKQRTILDLQSDKPKSGVGKALEKGKPLSVGKYIRSGKSAVRGKVERQ